MRPRRLLNMFNPLQWVGSHIPRSQAQLELEIMNILKLAFWVTLLAPVIIVPAFYLVLAILR
ncbi:MAG TPA: hypothetical protein VGR56_09265 [Nitrososphaerales archaeon]|nr:hypothetical protein [Nitrososphaerales archaeon]